MWRVQVAAAFMLFSPVRRMAAQTCADSHYRWTVRIADSLASVTPTRTSISAMPNTWILPIFTGQDTFKCAPRDGHELKTGAATPRPERSGSYIRSTG